MPLVTASMESGRPAMSEPSTEGFLKAALARAEHAEAKYRSLVALMPAITYSEDFDSGRVFAISPQVETILGYTQEEWMGEASLCVDRIHPEDRDRVVAACELANEMRQPYRTEYRMIARDGRIVWVRDEAVLVRGSQGQPLCWQGSMVDITAQKLIEARPERHSFIGKPTGPRG
jgi:PAS domain S-box-containing protein